MATLWVGIGELKCAAAGETLAAILGSCVSTVVWHPPTRFALMNHVLLPSRLNERGGQGRGRYADESWSLAMECLRERRLALRDCVCHLVGGGHGAEANPENNVGLGNIATVLDLLVAAGAQVDRMDTGGRYYRVAHFHSRHGTLTVRRNTSLPPAEKVRANLSDFRCGPLAAGAKP